MSGLRMEDRALCACVDVCLCNTLTELGGGSGMRQGTLGARCWDPWEACLHRAEEGVLIGLAAHRPHGVGYKGESRTAMPALLLGLSHCTLDPRRRRGTSQRPQTGGSGQAGLERRAGRSVMLEQRDRRRRSHNRDSSSQGDWGVRRVDHLGRRGKETGR